MNTKNPGQEPLKSEALLNMLEDLETEKKEAKESERRLKQAKEFSDTILNAMPDGIDMVDKTGAIKFMNKTFLKIFGKQAIGKKCWGVYKDNKKQCKGCPLKKSIQIGQTNSIEVEGVVGGKTFLISHTGVELPDGSKAVLEVFKDITEQKKAEETLKKSETKYHTLVEDAKDIIYTCDDKGNFKFINKNGLILLDVKPKEIIGKPWPPILPPNDRKRALAAYERMLKTGEDCINFENYFITKYGKGKKIWVHQIVRVLRDKQGKIIGTQGIARDITEQKKAEEELRENQEKYKALFEGVRDAIFVADPETRMLVDCNKAAEKLIGYSRKQILSMRADQLHPKNLIKKTMDGFKKQAEGKMSIVESEVITKDKKRIPVAINSAPMKIRGNDQLIGIFRVVG